MGTLTLSRFFVLHVFLIPACIFAFVAVHVYLFRRAGAAGPIEVSRRPTETFYPRQVVYDLIFSVMIIGCLGVLAHYAPTDLGPKANPADTQYIPRPEWYYVPVFQWLKYWQRSLAVVGILIIPGIVALVFLLLPFLDRRPERRPWKRPLAVTTYAAIFIGLGILGAVLGAGVGVGAMFAFYAFAGFRFPLLGVGIGLLTGLGAKLLAKNGEQTLGYICGGIALAAVVATLFLMYGEFPLLSIISVAVSVSFAYRIASK